MARKGLALLIAFVLAVAAYVAGWAWKLNTGQIDGAAIPVDTSVFWAAAKLALSGDAALAFDPDVLLEAQSLPPPEAGNSYVYRWHYPPQFLLLVAPLGLIGFSAAFAIFSAFGLGAYAWALSVRAREVPGALSLAVAAPATGLSLVLGNTSLLWAAAFLAAFHFVARERAIAAGMMIALLTCKPQLGLMIPVALAAGGHWRVILAGIAATVLLAGVATAAFGTDYWLAFIDSISRSGEGERSQYVFPTTMATWYGFARTVGLAHASALWVQAVSLALALVSVAAIWSRPRVAMDLKIALLCFATLLSTPYALAYELVLALVGAFFLVRIGVGRSPAGRAWLVALWLLPVPAWLLADVKSAHYAAPVLTLSAVLCLVLAWQRQGKPREGKSGAV